MTVADKLIDATERLLCEADYKDLSERRIAAAAGVHERMINYYFGQKDKLLFEVIARRCDAVLEKLDSLDLDPVAPDRVMRTIVGNLAEAYYAEPGIASIAISEIAKGNLTIRHGFIERYGPNGLGISHLKRCFDTLSRRQILAPDIPAEEAALSLVFIITSPFILALLSGTGDEASLSRFLEPRWLDFVSDLHDRKLRRKTTAPSGPVRGPVR